MTTTTKTFEISYYHHVYFGDYCFEDNHLEIDNVHSFDADGEKIEIDSINNKELFDRIYSLVEKKHGDEKATEEEYEAQLREDIEIEKGEEKRKYL